MGNFSIKNAEVNAPWWFKRLETALVFMFTGLIPLIGLSRTLSPAITHDLTLIVLPGLTLFVKSIGIFFGETAGPVDVKIETHDK